MRGYLKVFLVLYLKLLADLKSKKKAFKGHNQYNQLILFLIFVNSHCTHGTSCVNSPYYIRDQSQIVGHR